MDCYNLSWQYNSFINMIRKQRTVGLKINGTRQKKITHRELVFTTNELSNTVRSTIT
jgi:hypothetical protein